MAIELLCVGGPLAGSMARHSGHILSVEERPAPMSGIRPNYPYGKRTDYHTVRFYCAGQEIELWTCLSDLDTMLELVHHYRDTRGQQTPRKRIPPRPRPGPDTQDTPSGAKPGIDHGEGP